MYLESENPRICRRDTEGFEPETYSGPSWRGDLIVSELFYRV